MRPTPATWVMTTLECAFGYWLVTADWRTAGGVVIGLAIGTQLARVNRALFWKH